MVEYAAEQEAGALVHLRMTRGQKAVGPVVHTQVERSTCGPPVLLVSCHCPARGLWGGVLSESMR